MSRTGREIIMERLNAAIRRAKTADLHRAAAFLEWAYDIRKGCRKQRTSSRQAQAGAWQKNVDDPIGW